MNVYLNVYNLSSQYFSYSSSFCLFFPSAHRMIIIMIMKAGMEFRLVWPRWSLINGITKKLLLRWLSHIDSHTNTQIQTIRKYSCILCKQSKATKWKTCFTWFASKTHIPMDQYSIGMAWSQLCRWNHMSLSLFIIIIIVFVAVSIMSPAQCKCVVCAFSDKSDSNNCSFFRRIVQHRALHTIYEIALNE